MNFSFVSKNLVGKSEDRMIPFDRKLLTIKNTT